MQGLDSGAAMAFAAEGAPMLASNTAAQQELLQTGTALVKCSVLASYFDSSLDLLDG